MISFKKALTRIWRNLRPRRKSKETDQPGDVVIAKASSKIPNTSDLPTTLPPLSRVSTLESIVRPWRTPIQIEGRTAATSTINLPADVAQQVLFLKEREPARESQCTAAQSLSSFRTDTSLPLSALEAQICTAVRTIVPPRPLEAALLVAISASNTVEFPLSSSMVHAPMLSSTTHVTREDTYSVTDTASSLSPSTPLVGLNLISPSIVDEENDEDEFLYRSEEQIQNLVPESKIMTADVASMTSVLEGDEDDEDDEEFVYTPSRTVDQLEKTPNDRRKGVQFDKKKVMESMAHYAKGNDTISVPAPTISISPASRGSVPTQSLLFEDVRQPATRSLYQSIHADPIEAQPSRPISFEPPPIVAQNSPSEVGEARSWHPDLSKFIKPSQPIVQPTPSATTSPKANRNLNLQEVVPAVRPSQRAMPTSKVRVPECKVEESKSPEGFAPVPVRPVLHQRIPFRQKPSKDATIEALAISRTRTQSLFRVASIVPQSTSTGERGPEERVGQLCLKQYAMNTFSGDTAKSIRRLATELQILKTIFDASKGLGDPSISNLATQSTKYGRSRKRKGQKEKKVLDFVDSVGGRYNVVRFPQGRQFLQCLWVDRNWLNIFTNYYPFCLKDYKGLSLRNSKNLGDHTTISEHHHSLLFILYEIVSGLNFLHSLGIVVLSLTTETVGITADGHCAIVDFQGSVIATAPESSTEWPDASRDSTASRFSMTPPKFSVSEHIPSGLKSIFAAPELLEGHTFDEQADMWSLGMIMFDLLRTSSIEDVLSTETVKPNASRTERTYGMFFSIEPIDTQNASASEEMTNMIAKLLCRDPSSRPSGENVVNTIKRIEPKYANETSFATMSPLMEYKVATKSTYPRLGSFFMETESSPSDEDRPQPPSAVYHNVNSLFKKAFGVSFSWYQ